MDALSKILSDVKAAGVYRPTQSAGEIARAAKEAKLSIVQLDLGTVPGKGSFSRVSPKRLNFPNISAGTGMHSTII